MNLHMPELLSPAGNFEKLRAAFFYGADAVYLAGEEFGMRAAADNFTIDEIYEAYQKGKLEEVFGTGTAAVISPVGQLRWKDHIMRIGDGNTGPLSRKLYDSLTGIQLGELKDIFNWTVVVE